MRGSGEKSRRRRREKHIAVQRSFQCLVHDSFHLGWDLGKSSGGLGGLGFGIDVQCCARWQVCCHISCLCEFPRSPLLRINGDIGDALWEHYESL